MVENRLNIPRDPIEIRIPNAFIFPLQNLQLCLEQIEAGVVFEGVPLDNFRGSNRACRTINIAAAAFSGVVAARMLSVNIDGLKGKIFKTAGLVAFAHAASQAAGAYDKSLRQVKLDSKETICKQDLKV